jgi:peptidoglycan/LPS O-acetylase OafA/YrhL
MVMVEHATLRSRHAGQNWTTTGGVGVDIFFVVSGYIITMETAQIKR